MIEELNERSQQILRHIIDIYMATGEPVGSKTILDKSGLDVSAATIRNVMAQLEGEGLLFSPHISAGRLPTQTGLRFYVDGLMEIGDLTAEEQQEIESRCLAAGRSMNSVMEQATTLLSGLSLGAGLVIAPKKEAPVKQIQFVQIDSKQVLIVLVTADGMVENRLMHTDRIISPSTLIEASNYLSAKLRGKTLGEARATIDKEIKSGKERLDKLTEDLISKGIALPFGHGNQGHIIVRGQSNLLNDIRAIEDLEKAQKLMAMLEEQETMAELLGSAQNAEGVQIFIGTENKMFEHSGWSMAISPYKSQQNEIIGAIGVIGPNRLNYSRIIPLLDYTSRVVEKILSN